MRVASRTVSTGRLASPAWRTGIARRAAVLCAVCAVAAASASCGGQPGHPGSAQPTGTTPKITAGRRTTHCITHPSACGYPDESNTGVPPGTRLAPSGGITITKAGTVLSGMDVHGSITVDANDVTIRNTRVTTAGATGHNIVIEAGIGGTVIEDTTLRGTDAAANAIQYSVQNIGTDSTRGIRLDMFNCTTCWAGPGTLVDSYAITNAVIPGSHYGAVYSGGRAGPLVIEHDTLLNPHDQTATVFAGNDYGDQTGLTISGNLLAGGGYLIYGGAYGPKGATTKRVSITNNRFSNFYWPHGGHYGVAAYVNWDVTAWKGNYWDATGRIESGVSTSSSSS